ncbi:hypothetical protein [Shimia sp.]|uniref:hypothetical protein n=1 Tax=Shimia sp. TaxID=1954381 RepID=UPI00329A3022
MQTPPSTGPHNSTARRSLRARLGLPVSVRVGLPIAYSAALLLAPFAVAALGFWAMLIPVFAIWFGAIPYLCLAGPFFALALTRYEPDPFTFALIALFLNVASPLPFALLLLSLGYPLDWSIIAPLWQFGFYIAPFWGGAFAILYRGLRHLLTAPTDSV